MSEMLRDYLFTFLHPFRTHQRLRQENLGGIDIHQGIALSWLFCLPAAFYSLVTVHLGIHAWHSLYGEEAIMFDQLRQRYLILKVILMVIWFPLGAWIWVKFWVLLITFFARLFGREEESARLGASRIACNALACHTLLIIPVFGPLAGRVAGQVLLFAGLRRNLSFSVAQALLTLVSPLLLVLALIFVFFLCLAMLFIG